MNVSMCIIFTYTKQRAVFAIIIGNTIRLDLIIASFTAKFCSNSYLKIKNLGVIDFAEG